MRTWVRGFGDMRRTRPAHFTNTSAPQEFYFVLEGVGRMRVGEQTLTVPKYGGMLIGPNQLRQVFNDTADDVLWLIVGAPEELELMGGHFDRSLIYPFDPTQLPPELAGKQWPAKD